MSRMDELIDRYPALAPVREDIFRLYDKLYACFARGGKLLVCGNGGSNADAEHIVGELMKGFVKRRPLDGESVSRLTATGPDGALLAGRLQRALPAVSLNEHALSSAVINDLGGELAYAQQVWGLGAPGDAFLGISTSGNAQNVHYAALAAHERGMTVLGLTGGTGGKMVADCDAVIVVPERETYKIQELHLPIYHALCLMLEDAFFAQ